MHIRELRQSEWAMWDAFVRANPTGLPQHLAAWQQVLDRAYGYLTRYLAAWEGLNTHSPRLVGVLPLFLIDSPLMGRILTTPPGGLCADDADVAAALIAAGQAQATRLRAKRFVLHDTRRPWPSMPQTSCDHEHWLVDLRPGHDALWSGLDRNIRRQVRMAERNGLTAVVDRQGEHLDAFYRVLSRFSHHAGTPIFARRFLDEVVTAFPDGFNVVMVYHDQEPIGGYFQLELGKTNVGVWGAALHEHLELRPVYLAYWTIIADSIGRGFETLDMGRSPAGSNASKYKGQWATACAPVYQQTWSADANVAIAPARQAQQDGRFRMVRQVWPRLPLPVAQALGPLVRWHVPFA